MTTPTIDRLQTVANAAWTKQSPAATQAEAIDIVSIIIQIVMAVIQGCLPTPAPKMAAFLKDHPVLARWRIRRQMSDLGYSQHPQREKIFGATMDVVSQGDEHDVVKLIQECEVQPQ